MYNPQLETFIRVADAGNSWMLCKKPWIMPIPGIRKPERLKENAGAVQIHLSA